MALNKQKGNMYGFVTHTWKMRVTKFFRLYIQLAVSEPDTDVSEYLSSHARSNELFPTLTASDYKCCGKNTNYKRAAEKQRLPGVLGGPPNPAWAEWLMGFPIGWTDCEH